MRILMFLWERWRKPNRLRRCRWDMPPPQCCIVRQFKSESAACLRRGARTENFNTPERSWTAAHWANGVGGATGAMPRWRGRNGAHGGTGTILPPAPFSPDGGRVLNRCRCAAAACVLLRREAATTADAGGSLDFAFAAATSGCRRRRRFRD